MYFVPQAMLVDNGTPIGQILPQFIAYTMLTAGVLCVPSNCVCDSVREPVLLLLQCQH